MTTCTMSSWPQSDKSPLLSYPRKEYLDSQSAVYRPTQKSFSCFDLLSWLAISPPQYIRHAWNRRKVMDLFTEQVCLKSPPCTGVRLVIFLYWHLYPRLSILSSWFGPALKRIRRPCWHAGQLASGTRIKPYALSFIAFETLDFFRFSDMLFSLWACKPFARWLRFVADDRGL